MGRITVFVTDGNAACTRTIAAFRSRKVPVTIINLSRYPDKRNAMVALCMLQSTPQVFFNTRYVGGADETLALLNEWSSACSESFTLNSGASVTSKGSSHGSQSNKHSLGRSSTHNSSHSRRSSHTNQSAYGSVYERYMAEIGNFHDPTDKRLSIPLDVPPILDEPPLPRDPNLEYCIEIPGDESTYLEMTQMFLDLIKHQEHIIGATTYRKSFFGQKVIEVLEGALEINEKKALKIASQLLSIGLFHMMDSPTSTGISFDTEALYRLQCYHTPSILNSFRTWTESVDSNPLRLIHHLIMKFNEIEIDATDARGILHPSKAKKSNQYTEFEEGICELQGVNLSRMNDRMKIVSTYMSFYLQLYMRTRLLILLFCMHFICQKAFGINVYNLMIKYAIIKLGTIPASKKDVTQIRTSFLNTIKFNVGGHFYTFVEWEHGILRGNMKASSHNGNIAVPFSKFDPRLQYIVTVTDPRVLLCLLTNQGPDSCPEFGKYSAEDLDEELAITAECFCEKDCNFTLDAKKSELHLSKIFSTYRSEFVKDKSLLPHLLSKYARGLKKKLLDAMIESGKPIKIVDIPIDWRASHCTESYVFDMENLKLNEVKGGFLGNFSPKKSPTKKLTI